VAGEAQAFEVLVERETRRILRTCYRVLGRVDEAEEVTQETFVLAYRALGSYRGGGHPAAWITRIATREAWRHVAARSRRRSMTTTLDEGAWPVASDALDPATEAVMAEERVRVRVAVGRLPEPYREVITLRYFGELSLLEISAATGRPEGTVKAQVHRGLGRLRELLSEAGR
jgi:RNA polymerase sigma-70 factor (ECF subfamily)